MLKIATAIAALAGASSANAAILFSQNFDALPIGVPALGVPGFTIDGTVDVVQSGTFSIDCVGSIGKCLDLDGTPGPGAVTSDSIAFSAGNLLTVAFDLSGNQRNTTTDNFNFTFSFGSATDLTGFTCISGFIGCATGDLPGFTTSLVYDEGILGTRGFGLYSLSFTPGQAGTLQFRFGSRSADNIGPIIDNVVVSQVPEPASWAMLIAGFGLVGATMRRRRSGQSSVLA
jgi:hypothetical protein